MYKPGPYATSRYYSTKEYDSSVNQKYYDEKGGTWWGLGAERLGILGQPVLDGELDDLAKGLHPKTKEKIGRNEKTKRPYFDGVLSPVKDMSILYMLDETLGEKAYQEDYDYAENEALKYKESLATSRINNKNEMVASGLIIAKYQHETARPTNQKVSTIRPDMQLHTHCVTSKWAVDEDGKLRNLYNKKIFAQQKVIGAVFRAALAHRLTMRGFEVEAYQDLQGVRDDGKRITIKSFKIKGITDEQRDLFSKRKLEIDHLCDEEGSGSSKVRNRIAQQHKSIKTTYSREELKAIWKSDAAKVGLTDAYIQTLKTGNKKNFIANIKSDEALLQSVIYKNVVYEKDLLARLYENSQTTGINVPKVLDRMIKKGLIEKVGDYQYKCNVTVEKRLKADRSIRVKRTVDPSDFAKEFRQQEQVSILRSEIIKPFVAARAEEESRVLPPQADIKKKILPAMTISFG